MEAVLFLAGRAVIYCCYGWSVEVAFNAIRNAIVSRPVDWRLPGGTQLWTGLGYAGGGCLFELAHNALRSWPFPVRGLVYLPVLYGIEFVIGWTIKRWFGHAPWEYSGRFQVKGLIKLSYAPAWIVFLLSLERLHDGLRVALPVFIQAALPLTGQLALAP